MEPSHLGYNEILYRTVKHTEFSPLNWTSESTSEGEYFIKTYSDRSSRYPYKLPNIEVWCDGSKVETMFLVFFFFCTSQAQVWSQYWIVSWAEPRATSVQQQVWPNTPPSNHLCPSSPEPCQSPFIPPEKPLQLAKTIKGSPSRLKSLIAWKVLKAESGNQTCPACWIIYGVSQKRKT